jgi:hypothetical protein
MDNEEKELKEAAEARAREALESIDTLKNTVGQRDVVGFMRRLQKIESMLRHKFKFTDADLDAYIDEDRRNFLERRTNEEFEKLKGADEALRSATERFWEQLPERYTFLAWQEPVPWNVKLEGAKDEEIKGKPDDLPTPTEICRKVFARFVFSRLITNEADFWRDFTKNVERTGVAYRHERPDGSAIVYESFALRLRRVGE